MTRRGNTKTRKRDRDREQAAVTVAAALLGRTLIGARARFKEGFYTVIAKGQVGIDWWIVRRDDGYTTVFKEQDILERLV